MIFIVVRSRRRTSSKGSAALWLDAQVNPHVLHRTGATTYLFLSFGRRIGPPMSTHAPLRPKEQPPRAPSSCASKRSAPPPTCGWRRKASSKVNPSRFTQAATGRTTTWTCQHEPWTVVVVVVVVLARDVDEKRCTGGCKRLVGVEFEFARCGKDGLHRLERRAWRRIPRGNVTKRS